MSDKSQPGIALPSTPEQELNLIRYRRALSRRNFMSTIGMAGMASAGAAVLAGCGRSMPSMPAASGPSETDVLTFALNLEYLEANFYAYATTGSGIPSTDQGASPGAVTGGSKVTFSDALTQAVATNIAADELLHVQYLQKALSAAGAKVIGQPAINLGALGIGFASQAQFLTLARAFEDTGVSAYGGAATLLTGATLQAAAQILGTEAEHSGNIRYNCVAQGITCPSLDSQDVPPTQTAFFSVDSNALTIIRTPSQVLQIVFAAPGMTGVTKGGFFPDGVNTSSSTGISST